MKNKLEKVAEEAISYMSMGGGAKTASEAVKLATKNSGLNDESISRVCTMVNRKQHKLEKTSHGPGNLWKSRWSTAKPEEVMGKSEMNKTSSVHDASSTITKTAGVKNKFANLVVRSVEKKASTFNPDTDTFWDDKIKPAVIDEEAVYAKVKTASIRDMQEIIRTTEQALAYGNGRLEALTFEKVAAKSEAISTLLKFSKEASLTPGEEGVVLSFLTKESSSSEKLLIDLVTEWDRHRGVDLDAVRGTKRDYDGDLETEKIASAREDFTIRPQVEAALTNYTAFSDLMEIHTKIASYVDKVAESREVKATIKKLTADVKEMTSLFNEAGFYE